MRQQPGERDLGWRRVVAASDLRDDTRGAGNPATFHWAPRQERELLQRAELEDRLRGPVEGAVSVLDRHDRRQLLRPLRVLDGHVREADVPDLAFGLEFHQGSDRFLVRNIRIGAVKLIDIDLFDPQTLEAPLTCGAEVLGTPVRYPLPWPWTDEPAFGGDHELLRIRIQGLGDQSLTDLGAVGIGGVDEVDAELERAAQRAFALFPVGRFSPD